MSAPVASELLHLSGLEVTHAWPAGRSEIGRMLLVHGMWGGAWVWRNYLDFFAARGWDCHALNLRGHHGSRPVADLGRVRLADYVADAAEVAARLEAPVLVGHSMGGLVALKVAETLATPAVVAVTPAPPRGIFPLRGLALAAATVRYAPALLCERAFMPARRTMCRLAFNRLPAGERERVYARLVPASGRQAREIALPGIAVDPTRVTAPVLVVSAGSDRLTPPVLARRLARRYGADLREYPGFGHMIVMEPRWWLAALDIAAWLQRRSLFAASSAATL